MAVFILLRPHQWLKNLMLLFPPLLGGVLFQQELLPAVIALLGFSAAASLVYIINDLSDIECDRNHPLKKDRPLASGVVTVQTALVLAGLLGIISTACALFTGILFSQIVLLYVVISIAYSWKLKQIPLLELFVVVAGFLLRLLAGGAVFNVDISDWLFLSVFLLALYLIAGKRLSELRHEGGAEPGRIRTVLEQYPPGFLEGVMLLSGASALVTYTLYVINHNRSVWVIPLCCFGLLAFFRRVLSGRGGDPTRALLKDPMLSLTGCVWILFVAWEIYGRR